MADLLGYEKPPAKTMGMIMADGINKNTRNKDDYYPTVDTNATLAMLDYLGPILRKTEIVEKKCDSTIDLFLKK